jgi:hypothetical protein
MNRLPIHFSLIGAGVLSFFPLSAQAQLVINSTQNAAINGDNNQITQVINQTIIYRPQNSRSSRPGNMYRHNSGQDDDHRRGRNHGNHDDDDDRKKGRHREGQNDGE